MLKKIRVCKIFGVALALALCLSSLALPALADSWYFPVDEGCNETLLFTLYNAGYGEGSKALSVFLSNYAEAGVEYYDADSPDSVLIATVQKHLELNPGSRGYLTDANGQTYMKVSAEDFENKCLHLFGRRVAASSVPGYADGYVCFTVENYAPVLTVFATPVHGDYEGEGVYSVTFEIYCGSGSITEYYSVARNNLPMEKLTYLGSGRALFSYKNSTAQSFSNSDFTLISYTLDEPVAVPYANENQPWPLAAAPTETPKPVVATPQTTEESKEPVVVEITPAATAEPTTAPTETPEPVVAQAERPLVITPVLVAALIVALAVIALLAVLLLFKKKK